ncbi:hypothetical protein MRX96_011628 [Rhipicephalus microplus]
MARALARTRRGAAERDVTPLLNERRRRGSPGVTCRRGRSRPFPLIPWPCGRASVSSVPWAKHVAFTGRGHIREPRFPASVPCLRLRRVVGDEDPELLVKN